jgi:hypothetical protein
VLLAWRVRGVEADEVSRQLDDQRQRGHSSRLSAPS